VIDESEMKEKLTYGVWDHGGAVVAMIIGFVWGGWTTSSTSQTKTMRRSWRSGSDLRRPIH